MLKKTFHIAFQNQSILNLAYQFSHLPGLCLLYSGGTYASSSLSYLSIFPKKEILLDSSTPWQNLHKKLTPHYWFGYLSYEMGAFSDEEKVLPHKKSDIPLGHFQRYLITVKFDSKSNIIELFIDEEYEASSEEQKWVDRFLKLTDWFKELQGYSLNCAMPSQLLKKIDFVDYEKKCKKVKEYILEGDVYQVNLTHESIAKTSISPFLVFARLANKNPSPFSAYISHENYTIVSTSPERLLLKQGDFLQTKPIKGSIKRDEFTCDKKQANNLLTSIKDRAELAMITDLARNDLGKLSEVNSIKTKPFLLEKYENIIHMLSEVNATAKKEISSLEYLRALFPGGSITGCPKLRAQEIIFEIEKRARHVYTGSIGYLTPEQDFDFNIAIRTLLFQKEQVSIQLGGAIVADSTAQAEYYESLQKGISIFQALNLDYKNEFCFS
ncbi:MAG: anthranilate synthase component I family protein [Chlamydiota bacterium]